MTIVLQCKRYSGSVGNGAVQEAIAAKHYYGTTHAAVVTNASFTKWTVELANAAGVILQGFEDLGELDKRLQQATHLPGNAPSG